MALESSFSINALYTLNRKNVQKKDKCTKLLFQILSKLTNSTKFVKKSISNIRTIDKAIYRCKKLNIC